MKDFAEEEKNRPRRRTNTVSVYLTIILWNRGE